MESKELKSSFKIHPLHVGTITRPATSMCYGLDPGKMMRFPLICWYVEGGPKKVLVDTGGVDPSEAKPQWLPYERTQDQSLDRALREIGVRCEDIDVVVITHLHWDHSGGLGLFPKAEIIVQEAELESARSPFPVVAHGYIPSTLSDVDYTVITGDQEISKGITLMLTPGHTYGMQGVLVEGETRRIFIASDTFGLFKNLEQDPPMISGSYVDLKAYYGSLEKIAGLSAFVLPGHDSRVFEERVYC